MDFEEFASYPPESCVENQVYSGNNPAGVESTNVLPPIDTVTSRDVLVDRLHYQVENNPTNLSMYARAWEGSPGYLNQQLRLELASRYEASGDTWYRVDSVLSGPYRGEKHLFYQSNRNKVYVNLGLIDLLKRNK